MLCLKSEKKDLLKLDKPVIEVTLLDYLRSLFEEGQKLSELAMEMRDLMGFEEDVDIDEMS